MTRINFKKFLIFLLVSFFFFINVGSNHIKKESCSASVSGELLDEVITKRYLRISCQANPDARINIPSESINKNFNKGIYYRGVQDVTIEVNNQIIPLEEALGKDLISENEIWFFARLDAKNGVCDESVDSNHGLTHFTYHYPDYNLRIIYDIYETPDGSQHLISTLCLFTDEMNLGTYVDFTGEDGLRLDRENWGLNFEVTEITSGGLTLNCLQSGGQQIGTLSISAFTLTQDGNLVPRLDGSAASPSLVAQLRMNDSTTVNIDWKEYYGDLPSGKYQLSLAIDDIYDSSQVHPLMQNFHDMQYYDFLITIP